MVNNKGLKELWGYPLIDEKARNAISDTRSSLENDFQKKTDDTLGTVDKTVPGAINEIKNNIDNIGDNFTSEQSDTKYDMKYNGKSIGSIGIELKDNQIAGGDGSFNIDLTPYQTKTDTSLTTNDKTLSGAINEVNTQCKDIGEKIKENPTYYIQKNFFDETNIQERLEKILNDSNIKNIVFPYGLSITLEKQLIVKRDNLQIDFNNCEFSFSGGYSATVRTDLGGSIACIIITFIDCNNINIKNIRFNGKRALYNGTDTINLKWQTGLTIWNCSNFTCENFYCKEMNYHAIVVYNSKNVLFNVLNFYNNGKASGGAGYSDVYAYEEEGFNSDVTFLNTYSERTDTLATNTGQIYYMNNSKSFIQNVNGKNVAIPFDCRNGRHIIKDVFVDGGIGLKVDSYPENTSFANIIAENIEMINLIGSNAGGALLYVTACDGLIMRNIKLKSVSNYEYFYGIFIKKGAEGAVSDLSNIILENVVLDVQKSDARCVVFDSLVEPIYIKNLKILNTKGHNGLKSLNCTTDINIENFSANGEYLIKVESQDNKIKIKNPVIYGTGAPTQKPDFIALEYLDTTNKCIYKSFGSDNVNDWSKIN